MEDQQASRNRAECMTIRKGHLYRFLLLVFFLGIVAASLIAVLYFNVLGKGQILSGQDLEYYRELDSKYGKYYKMEKAIEANSLYDIDAGELDKAIAIAVLGIVDDKYAEYYTAAEYEAFARKYFSDYCGIGVAIKQADDGSIYISRVIQGGPAAEAGIEEKDVIFSVDGQKPASLDEASNMISGDPGSKVKLVIVRGGSKKTYDVYRQEVEDESVAYEKLDGNIGYVKISIFREGTADSFADAVKALKNDGINKIIVDLRGNGGGVTDEGIKCADLLLPACKILTIRNNSGKETVHNSDETTLDVRYVVLVDGDTGSAAEIMAGAIKDNRGGTIIGRKTYGKGVIQNLYKMPDGSVIKITTEEYILPSGETINDIGITPDIETSGEGALSAAINALAD